MQQAVDYVRQLAPGIQASLVVAAFIVVAMLANIVVSRVLFLLAPRTRTDLDDRLLRQARRPIFMSVVLVGLYYAIVILDPADDPRRLAVGALHTLAVFIWLVAGLKICHTLIEGLSTLAGRVHWLDERTIPLFDNLAKILIVGGAVYCLLLAWNLDVTPWLASAGILGIAIGFAAKDTLANLFGGLFIIIDAPYKIGDFVNLDTGERGRVTKIGLRSTRLMTRDDVEITLPNAQIANSKIVNESGGASEKSRVAIQVGVAYGSDVDRVRQVILDAVRTVPEVAVDPEPRVRFIEMADSALTFRVMCWIDEPVLRGRCVDGLNTAVYKALNAAGINIPFPQRVVHVHGDRKDLAS